MPSDKDLLIRFEEFKLALDLAEKEADRFWARNNVLLLVQAALIAFYDSINNIGNSYGLLVTAQGFFLSLIWIGVLIKGKNYISRWDVATRDMESKLMKDFPGKLQGLIKLNDKGRKKDVVHPIKLLNKSTTTLITYFVYSLMLFWGGLFIVVVSPLLADLWSNIILPSLRQLNEICQQIV